MNGKTHSDDISAVLDEEVKAKEIKQRKRNRGGGGTTAEERELVERVELRQMEKRRARLLRAMTPEERRRYENPLAGPEVKRTLVVNPCGLGG